MFLTNFVLPPNISASFFPPFLTQWFFLIRFKDIRLKEACANFSDGGWKWLNKIWEDGAKNAIGLIYHYARQSLKEDDDV